MDQKNGSSPPSQYFIDQERMEEMHRLALQDKLLSKAMGGVLPQHPDFVGIQDILDIGCGSGGWILDVAKKYPEKHVTGIDVSERMIEFNIAQARSQGISNAAFTVANALKPLEYPDNSFDLVNARLIFGFMSNNAWPTLLQEAFRILRPGGVVRLTEGETPISTAPAYQELNALVVEAMKKSGQSFSPDGRYTTITPVLHRFLQDAGFLHIQEMAYVINFSAGMEAHDAWYKTLKVAFQLFQPFLLKWEVTTQEKVKQLYQQMGEEMQSPDFMAVIFLLSAWAKKSGAS